MTTINAEEIIAQQLSFHRVVTYIETFSEDVRSKVGQSKDVCSEVGQSKDVCLF